MLVELGRQFLDLVYKLLRFALQLLDFPILGFNDLLNSLVLKLNLFVLNF